MIRATHVGTTAGPVVTRVHLEESLQDWARDLVITYTWADGEWTGVPVWDTAPGQGELMYGEWTEVVVKYFLPQAPVTACAEHNHQTIRFSDDPVPEPVGEPVDFVEHIMGIARAIGYPGVG
jgi:hypothetical protein